MKQESSFYSIEPPIVGDMLVDQSDSPNGAEGAVYEEPIQESDVELSKEKIAGLVSRWIPESVYKTSTTHPETGQEHTVLDIVYLKAAILKERRYNGSLISREKIALALFERHKNDRVLTPAQVEHEDYVAKSLFYTPASVESATTLLGFVDEEFHLPLWELEKNSVLRNRDSLYPTLDGSELSAFETRVALILFHPAYGDGRRDKNGELQIKNPDYEPADPLSSKRIKFSRDLIRRLGINLHETGDKKSRSMRDGLIERCPHLLRNDVLRLNDVRDFTIDRDGVESDTFEKQIGGKYVMLRGVNQYVGDRFIGCTVLPFGKNKALIFDTRDGHKKLRAIFNVINKDNASATSVSNNGTKVPRANGDKTQLQEIDYNAMLPAEASGLQRELLIQKRLELETRVAEVIEQLIESARNSENLIVSELDDSGVSADVREYAVERIRNDLLNQAEQAIYTAANARSSNELLRSLEDYAFDARTYVSVLKSIGVEKMISTPLDRVNAVALRDKDKDMMWAIIRENYMSTYPGEENRMFRETVIASFEAALNRPTTDFYVLRDGDKIVSFNRFDTNIDTETHKTVLYFGSFNADPRYRGVGSIMLEHTIQEKLKECDAIQAHCDPESEISKKYIEDGFIATNTETVAGKFSFEIWRSKESTELLKTKQMSHEELIAIAGDAMPAEADYFVREVEPDDQFLELDSGLAYLLTRYFTQDGKTYAAFEFSPGLSKSFTAPQAK